MTPLRIDVSLPWDVLPGPLAFVDVETTGTGASDRVVEIAVIRMSPDEPAVAVQTLVDHGRRPVGAAFIHQIDGEMLDGAPSFADVVPVLQELLEGATLVAHNASFEKRMLSGELRRLRGFWGVPHLCTLSLARRAWPGRSGRGAHTLGSMVRLLGLPSFGAAHTAWADTRQLPHLLEGLLARGGDADERRRWVEASIRGGTGEPRWPRARHSSVRLKAR